MRFRRGFTLFEVLIAMVLVVMLMATLSSTLSVAWRQKRAAENAVDSVRDTQAVGDIIVDALKDALPPWTDENGLTESDFDKSAIMTGSGTEVTNADGTTTEQLYIPHLVGPFHGDASSVGFFASGSEVKATVTSSPVRWMEFAAVSGYSKDGNLSLVRRVETNLLRDDWDVDTPSSSGLEDEVLIHHVIDLKFQYADVDGNMTDTWYSEDNQNTLPFAVIIDLTLAPLDEKQENRVIHRVAAITCAAPPKQVDDGTGTGTTGGIISGPNTGFGN